MAKATAKANEEGLEIDAVMGGLAKKISESIVHTDLFKDESMKARLGNSYEKVIARIEIIEMLADSAIGTGIGIVN